MLPNFRIVSPMLITNNIYPSLFQDIWCRSTYVHPITLEGVTRFVLELIYRDIFNVEIVTLFFNLFPRKANLYSHNHMVLEISTFDPWSIWMNWSRSTHIRPSLCLFA